MPYKSLAQERYFNANRGKLESQGVDVDEWNSASRGMKLPEKKVDLGSKGSFNVKKGALHEMLGISPDSKIPASKLQPHSGDSTLLKRRKASARGFRSMNHG